MVFLAAVVSVQAQFPGGGGGKGVPNMGHVYGKLEDSTGHPIAEATVLLMHNKYDSATKKSKMVLLERSYDDCKRRIQF